MRSIPLVAGSTRASTLALALVAGLLLAAEAVPLHAAEISGLKLASPQPKKTQPGLAVTYWFMQVRSVKEMKYWMQDKGNVGAPLPMLNYRSGRDNVLSSNKPDGVMAAVAGFIKFDPAGTYKIWMRNNDGAVLRIGGETVINDGEWHARGDVLNGPVDVAISKPGWYPLEIHYFERKGTSTLELFWLPPGASGEMTHVPAEALAHSPK